MTAQFEPVARRTVSGEIGEQLSSSILDGRLSPGERVPSERSLCEDFGVARTSVREALQGLVSVGLIERRGNRSFVVEHLPGVAVASDRRKVRVAELFEVRRLIEVPMAELAACRASAAERAEIATVAAAFHPDLPLDDFRAFDRRFHALIGRACGNPLLAELYAKVLDALFRSEEFSSLLSARPNKAAVRRIIRDSTRAHQAIAVGIVAGEPIATVAAVERHLREVEDRMIAQLH